MKFTRCDTCGYAPGTHALTCMHYGEAALTIEVDPTMVRFDGDVFTIDIVPEILTQHGLIDADDAQIAQANAVEQAEKDLTANLWYELRTCMDGLLNAAECDRLEDAVSTTDLLLHGPAVAAIREAIALVADIVKAEAVQA